MISLRLFLFLLLFTIIIGCANTQFFVSNTPPRIDSRAIPCTYQNAIETFNVDSNIFKKLKRNDSALLSAFDLLMNNKLEEAQKVLINENISDSYGLLNATQLLAFNIYYPEQMWKQIISLDDTKNKLQFLKKIASFYNEFSSTNFEFINNCDSVLIPFSSKSHIIINVKINDKRYRFLLDTGSSECFISAAIAKTLDNSNKLNDSLVFVDGINNSMNAIPSMLSNLEIGNLRINNLPVLTTTSNFKNFDGIIGWNLLKQQRIKINYQNKYLVIYKKHLPKLNDVNLFGNILPFVRLHSINDSTNQQLLMLFDTGSDQTRFFVSNDFEWENAGRSYKQKIKSLSGKEISLIKKIKEGYLNINLNEPSFYFKNLPITRDKITTQYVKLNGVLGSDFFSKGGLEFDFSSNYLNFHY